MKMLIIDDDGSQVGEYMLVEYSLTRNAYGNEINARGVSQPNYLPTKWMPTGNALMNPEIGSHKSYTKPTPKGPYDAPKPSSGRKVVSPQSLNLTEEGAAA